MHLVFCAGKLLEIPAGLRFQQFQVMPQILQLDVIRKKSPQILTLAMRMLGDQFYDQTTWLGYRLQLVKKGAHLPIKRKESAEKQTF